MKEAGNVPFLDYNPSQDSQTLSTFEGPEGKTLLEVVLGNKLLSAGVDTDSEHGTLVD